MTAMRSNESRQPTPEGRLRCFLSLLARRGCTLRSVSMNALGNALTLFALLLSSCAHQETRQKVSATEAQQHIVGTWWCDHYAPDGPFYLVTFHQDGRWTSVNTNTPTESPRQAYWRVDTSGMLLITKTRDALPSSNLEMFVPDSVTERRMVFGQPSTAGRITFTK
jgi:hypothetical protein